MDTGRRAGRITLKTMGVHGFDHRGSSVVKIRNASRLGSHSTSPFQIRAFFGDPIQHSNLLFRKGFHSTRFRVISVCREIHFASLNRKMDLALDKAFVIIDHQDSYKGMSLRLPLNAIPNRAYPIGEQRDVKFALNRLRFSGIL